MEGDGDRTAPAAAGESSAPEGDEQPLYSFVRCASQSSLDECSQRPAPAAEGDAEPEGVAHAGRLLGALARLRGDGALCDVRLLARPEPARPEPEAEADAGVWAHRAVLAAASPYFRAMFTQFEERSRPSVTLQGVDPTALEDIVRWVYEPASLRVREDSVQALLAAASLLQVEGVRAAAAAFLRRALQPDNALGIRAFAELHACSELQAAAARYVQAHAHLVLQSDEFLALSPDALSQLLRWDCLAVPGEEAVLDAVLRWTAHDAPRREHLPLLLEHVRLPLVPQDALVARAAAEPIASAGLRVKDLVIEALSFHLMRPERRAAAAAASVRARPRRAPRAPAALLVVGGQAPKAIRDVEAFHVECARWRPAAALPSRRCRAGVAVVPGPRVYAVGGFNGTLRVRSVDVYDVGTDAWSAGPALGARRSTLGVAVLEGRVFAVGGFDGATGLSSAEALDPREGVWRPVAGMSTRRSSVGVGVLGGRLYAVGGYDGASRQCLHSVERYDAAADRWEPAPDMGARRSGAGVAVLGEALYAVGGHDGPAVRRSVERYVEGAGWTTVAGMGTARRNAGVASHAGRLYVAGGDDGAANLPTVEVYEAAADTWSLLPAAMAVGRSYAGVAVVERPA